MPACVHLVEPVHTGGGLFGDTLDVGRDLVEQLRRFLLQLGEQLEHDRVLLAVGRLRAGNLARLLELDTLVDQQRDVAAVVEDHVGAATVGPLHDLLGAPPVLLERLALPREHRDAAPRPSPRPRGPASRRCCSSTHRSSAPSATSVSISTAVWIVMWSEPVMRAPASGLRLAELLAARHEAGHLDLGERDLLAAELGQRDVGDLVVGERARRGHARFDLGHVWSSGCGARSTGMTHWADARHDVHGAGPDHRVTAHRARPGTNGSVPVQLVER